MAHNNYRTSRREKKNRKYAPENQITDVETRDVAQAAPKNVAESTEPYNHNSSNARDKVLKRKREKEEAEEKGAKERKRKLSKKFLTKDLESSNKEDNFPIKLTEKGKKKESDNTCKKNKRDKHKNKENKTSHRSLKTTDDNETSSNSKNKLMHKKSQEERKAEPKLVQQLVVNDQEKDRSRYDGVKSKRFEQNYTENTVETDDAIKMGSNHNKDTTDQKKKVSKKTKTKTERAEKQDQKSKDKQQQLQATDSIVLDSPRLLEDRKSSKKIPEKTTTVKTGMRFIVFVGNLPYTATTTSIMAHFSKLKPISVRNLTPKDNLCQSRGAAFVEFENFDTHKTALKTMHHSIFDDANLSVSAGGGGNNESRRIKIKQKNERLNEQRNRVQEKAELNEQTPGENISNFSESYIHPSRRRMIVV